MYKFRLSTEEETAERLRKGSCHIMAAAAGSEEAFARFYGQLRTVFGEPQENSDDYEAIYSYSVTAEDENGNRLLLEAYHGPSGAAIGGPVVSADEAEKEIHRNAAMELIDLVSSAEPSDYEWEGVYEDVPVNIKYVVKDGKVRTESSFPEGFEDFDPEDLM